MATTRIWVAYWHWYSSSAIYAATSVNVLTDTRRLITSNRVRMTHQNRRHTWCTTTWIICTDGQCVNLCHTSNFDESKTRTRQRSFRICPSYILIIFWNIGSINTTDTLTCHSAQPAISRPANARINFSRRCTISSVMSYYHNLQ